MPLVLCLASICVCTRVDECDLMYEAMKNVQSTSVSSPVAVATRELASCLIECCGRPQYVPEFSTLANKVVKALLTCFVNQYCGKHEREMMLGSFHKLRTSMAFKNLWATSVSKLTTKALSTDFYQHVTHQLFKELIKRKFSPASTTAEATIQPLTKVEENTLRHFAGYVCRTVKTELESCTNTNKEAMIFCIMELSGDEEDEERGTEDWVNLIDRGGLWHISDKAYRLFYAIEEEVRCYLAPEQAGQMDEGTKEKILSGILNSDDVLFQWTMFGPELDNKTGKELLERIAKLYVTCRGFSFASSFVEKYKQENKTTLQKGKGLRKKLYTSNINE